MVVRTTKHSWRAGIGNRSLRSHHILLVIAGGQTIGSAVTIPFRPLASGVYHVAVLNPNVFENLVAGVQATIHLEIHGGETWTTTTVG